MDTKVTNRRAFELLSSFRFFNGRQVVVKQAGKDDQVVNETYNLGAKAAWNIARNLSVLSGLVKAFQKARLQLDKNDPKAFETLLDQESEVKLLKIPALELNVGTNSIAPGDLADVLEFLDGVPE